MRERTGSHYDEAVKQLKAAHELRREAATKYGFRTPGYYIVHLAALEAYLHLRALESSMEELLDCLLDPDGNEHAAAFKELAWRLEPEPLPRSVAELVEHVPAGHLVAHVASCPDDAPAVAELMRRLVDR